MIELSKRQQYIPYLMIIPAFVLIVIFKLLPIFTTVFESVVVDSKVTLSVYERVGNDPTFWNSLWVTVKMNLVMIPLQVLLSFILALMVNASIKGIGMFRTIYYLPVTISMTVATIIWNLMLNPNNGIFNSIINFFGFDRQGFLIDPKQALWCIVAIATWKGVGYWMMFFLTGLKQVDSEIYESARIDGAGYLRIVLQITLPLIKNTILFVCVANTTANLMLFVPMQLITRGGPANSTNVLMYEAYKSAFRFIDRPRPAVLVTIILFLILLVSLIQDVIINQRIKKKKIIG